MGKLFRNDENGLLTNYYYFGNATDVEWILAFLLTFLLHLTTGWVKSKIQMGYNRLLGSN